MGNYWSTCLDRNLNSDGMRSCNDESARCIQQLLWERPEWRDLLWDSYQGSVTNFFPDQCPHFLEYWGCFSKAYGGLKLLSLPYPYNRTMSDASQHHPKLFLGKSSVHRELVRGVQACVKYPYFHAGGSLLCWLKGRLIWWPEHSRTPEFYFQVCTYLAM